MNICQENGIYSDQPINYLSAICRNSKKDVKIKIKASTGKGFTVDKVYRAYSREAESNKESPLEKLI